MTFIKRLMLQKSFLPFSKASSCGRVSGIFPCVSLVGISFQNVYSNPPAEVKLSNYS
jgi:hypothetical protein